MPVERSGGIGGASSSRNSIHQTNEFRENLRRIRDGEPVVEPQPAAAKVEQAPVQFNVPLPSTVATRPLKKRGGTHSTTFNQTLYDQKLRENVREQVVKNMGIKQNNTGDPYSQAINEMNKKKIEDETNRLVDIIKRPRTVFIKGENGEEVPFYLSKADERAELEKSLLGESPWKRGWMLTKFDIASGITGIANFINMGAVKTKEFITDTSAEGNVAGSIAQLGLNSGMLTWEYLRALDTRMLVTEDKYTNLVREAEALKYSDPRRAAFLAAEAALAKEQLDWKAETDRRMTLAEQAVDRSWESVFQEVKESNEFAEKYYDPNMKDPKTGRVLTPLEQQAIYLQNKREEAAQQATDFRSQAATAYASGDYSRAIELTRLAQEQDRNATTADPYGAYTWIREPEREARFKENAALLELQKGAPLSPEEIRRLKEYHVNGWTEMTGEMIFDPINLVPAVVMEKALKVPIQSASKANRALMEAVPAYAKTLDVLGSPVRWLMRESVNAGATRVSTNTHNIMERISNAYTSTTEVTRAIDDISAVVLEARRATGEPEARVIFESAKETIPGLQQITFSDFKNLMDAGEHLDPTEWGKIYSDAFTNADDTLTDIATKTNKPVEEVASDVSKHKMALEGFAEKFYDAFKDPHRIFNGSRLTDDTVAGWITKSLRELSGDKISEQLVKTKFDDWLVGRSEKLGLTFKHNLQSFTHVLEASLTFAANMRDLWATTVLTTFRWPINNLADTSMRSLVHGGNLWDDLTTLFTSTQRLLADELGMSPIEFNQALSRPELKFTESVPHRLVYEGWKPKAGLFSYIGYEYKRLLTEFGDDAVTKTKLTENILKGMPDGMLKRNLAALFDGYNYRVNLWTGLRALPGGISDFNTAIEFTFRLRMFHREYFNLLKKIEPEYLARSLEGLNPAVTDVAKQIWEASEGNPRRITAYVDNLLGGKKNTPANWSFAVPPEISKTLGQMDAADRQLFMSAVKNELDEFVQTAIRNGQDLKPEDFRKFFTDYKTKMQDEIQFRMSQTHDFRDMDAGIRTDGIVNEVPTEDTIRGSMPTPKETNPRNEEIDKAISKLKRKKWGQKPVDIANNLETALTDYAKVERVPGEGVRVVKRGTNLTVQIGDESLKKGPAKLYNQINRAVIDILKNQDTDLIRLGGFRDLAEYDEVMTKFLENPTDVLNANERQFLTIVNQMEENPRLRQIIEQTSPTTIPKYDSALDIYREIGEYSDVYGFTKRPDVSMMSEAERIRPLPGSHIAAVTEMKVNLRKMIDTGVTISPEMADRVREFVAQLQVHRQELKQFYAFTYPGPLMRATTEGGRHAGWDLFYRLSEAEFRKETEIATKLTELMQRDPEAALKYMDEANGNFAEFFLKENGVELEWDADRQMILNMKVRGLDGKHRNFTARRDIANLQIRFFAPKTREALEGLAPIRIAQNPQAVMRKKLMEALRNTFQTDTAHADAWSKVIDNHAQKWAQETGQPIEKYYERLSFQQVETSSAYGLGTLENTRIVKRGAIQRNPDGTFRFFGLTQSNFESMVRETGELFYDDLVSMAEHSEQAADDLKHLKDFIESKTGKKIRGDRLQQEHSDVLADVFSSYVATGHGPNISVKGGFERMKAWMTSTFDAVRDTKLAGQINDDVYRVLDRMFVESKIADVPSTNARTIQLMAKEANLVVDSEEDLLNIINTALHQPVLDEAAQAQAKVLEDAYNAADAEYRALLNEQASLAGDNAMANATIGNNPAIQEAERKMQEALDALDAFHAQRTPAGPTYTKLGDVPTEVAARVLGTPEKPLESTVMKELQEGWEVWKTQRALKGFPEEALASPDTFKAYLKQRMGEEWSEAANYYNRLQWEVEQFQDAMLNYHAGNDLRTTIFPRVHEAQVSNGMKTFIRNQQGMISNYEMARTALDQWAEYMAKLANDGHPATLLTKEDQAALKAWSSNAANDKAEMVGVLLHGNDKYDGAIPLVNKRMLDYQHTNVTDQFMKNFFPFWMFPSRSFPFWAETMATHPQLIAAYEKIQALSRSQRYQSGAVTSQGKPLPSLDGYIKLPGTDMWFNPLAPLSFRYLLDVQKSKDDVLYAAQSEDNVDPQSFLASELMNMGQIYGFSLAPWAAWGVKKKLGIPDEIIPRYPLLPEIQLIPRWWVQEQVQRANKVNLFGWNWQGIADTIYPEVPWHDSLVERRILENALQQIQSGNLSEDQKIKIMNEAQNAIKNKQSNLWLDTYKEVTSEESTRSIASFFTGVYAKEFGDGQADLLALRNDINLLKSAMNNEFQSSVFDLPTSADAAWDNYLKQMDTPEGWVHRLYADTGWVRNEQGELVRNPKERAYWLAKKIEMDEDQQMYYDKMATLQNEFNKRIRALPVGADWEQSRIIYEWYADERSKLDYLRTFERVYGSNKPVELIQRDIASDWFRQINGMKPNWDIEGGETYEQYQQRVADWEMNLDKMAPLYMRAFMRNQGLVRTLGSLHTDQQFNTGEFFQALVAMTNKEGLVQYEKENDDIFDALNKAWKATYWDEYWHGVIGKSGYEVDLAEKDFYGRHPTPPDANQLYSWITNYYGTGRFSLQQIEQYVNGTDTLSVNERQLQGQADPEDYQKRQEIWNMLSWLGPGSANRNVFNTAFANAGGDPDWLTTWYQENGQAYKAVNPERLDQLHNAIQTAVSTLNLQPPSRAELVRYIQAQEENGGFKQLVSAELGNQFFDYTDENGTTQPGVYSYYNSLDTKSRREFRKANPEEYAAIQDYYALKEMFAEEHPVWADYYGFDAEPTVSLPTDANGSTYQPPSLSGPTYRGGGGGGGGGGSRPEPRPTQSVFNDYPSFNIGNRTSNYISPGLYQLVGDRMGWEITSFFANGRRISSAGVSFLRTIASRYPQYQSEISQILGRGT